MIANQTTDNVSFSSSSGIELPISVADPLADVVIPAGIKSGN